MAEHTAKRLIFVTSRLPWPTNSGRKVSLYHYCRGLHEKYGYEISGQTIVWADSELDGVTMQNGKTYSLGEVEKELGL